MSTTARLRATMDSYVYEGNTDRNFGDAAKLSVDGAGTEKRAFIAFPLKSIPTDANIHAATLRLHLRGSWGGTNTITVQRVSTSWNERRLTWANQPNVVGVTPTEVISGGSAGDLVEVDVGTLIAAAVERGQPWHGVRIILDTSGTKDFHSSEVANHSLRPQLDIEYSVPPGQPVRLRPRGGDAVDAAKPRLAWDADSQSASRVITGSTEAEVGVDENGNLTGTPDYDSGQETNDETGWSLNDASSPTFPAIADGDTVYWRVKIWDEDGNESPWSHIRNFERRTYGTFSIDSPAVDLDGVEDPTPTIITSLTGRTLTRIGWRLERRLSGSGKPFGKVSADSFQTGFRNSDGTFELPRIPHGEFRRRDEILRIIVRAWDEYDRGTAPGDRSYVSDHRLFVYDPTAGTTAVSALTATQPTEGSPIVRLNWTRSSSPDNYDVYVDDDLYHNHVDPGDVFVSGTSWQMDLYDVTPGHEHTFEVVANENGKDSLSNPTVNLTPVCKGTWLVCAEEEIAFLVGTHDVPSLGVGEIGADFELLGHQKPVRIIDTVRGLEGSIRGDIFATEAGTARQMRRRLTQLKELSSETEVRAVWNFQNFPVLIGEISDLSPVAPLESERYSVEVQIRQSEEFEVRP